jgi:bacterioferritin-associated ferredoxin
VIVCSCAVVSHRDIELAVAEIMNAQPGVLPTPGMIFRFLDKKMNCCTCAPVAISAINTAIQRLAQKMHLAPPALTKMNAQLIRIVARKNRPRRQATCPSAAITVSSAA